MSDIFTVKCATCGENDVNYMGTTCEPCRDNFWTKVQNTQALIDENTVLRAEVEELRKDRERLEWIFTNAYYVYSMDGPSGEEYFYVYDSNGTQISEFHCDGPREAIDTAVEAAKTGGE